MQREVPDTLLLAEAFWMMESYFVRSLGMHRVYNSAFMNMIRNEENEKYRLTIKKTQEFDPEILKRFVNFMNNPDEETAVKMFGKGDKYFGVCMLMVTMPGLPMFGHGQVEGFSEKYGMEYRKAYWNEEPDLDLIRRHEREIFPLMKKRYIFADAASFMLYDLHASNGGVNENVYAYTNRAGAEAALVLFNNSIHEASGRIKVSAPYADKNVDKQLRQKVLGDALGLHNQDGYFMLVREHMSNLWYIRPSWKVWEEGLFVHLNGYQYQVFMDVQEVADNAEGHYRRLSEKLNGAGVQNIDDALKEIYLKPILDSIRRILDPEIVEKLSHTLVKGAKVPEAFSEDMQVRYREFLGVVRGFAGGDGNTESLISEFSEYLNAAVKVLHSVSLPDEEVQKIVSDVASAISGKTDEKAPGTKKIYSTLDKMKLEDPYMKYSAHILIGWLFFRCIGPEISSDYSGADSVSLMDQWFLDRRLKAFYIECGMDGRQAEQAVRLVKILISHEGWIEPNGKKKLLPGELMSEFLRDTDVTLFIGENRYNEVLWFQREGYRSLVWWLYIVALSEILVSAERNDKIPATRLREIMTSVNIWLSSLETSGYRVDRLLEAASGKKTSK